MTFGLWSKLRTGRWPQWPDWQDGVRQMVPVFQLRLRPCAIRSDGAVNLLTSARVTVSNHDGSQTVADEVIGAPSALAATDEGIFVRLLRGLARTLCVCISQTTPTFSPMRRTSASHACLCRCHPAQSSCRCPSPLLGRGAQLHTAP